MALHQKDERKTSCTQVLAYMSSRENTLLCDAVVTCDPNGIGNVLFYYFSSISLTSAFPVFIFLPYCAF